ncbi:TadE/TadG family type IV pilus assembly protein [Sphingomonas mucosissima]|uniref:Putative Flp pilus-assembly TadG-like N-terminal domain-containing protein n=1 Tax=Sphingomonas mucosissima TaxID=370959 RepID=A0A245ZTA3_9SPHN|nr:TadE/TadG family type IV pilus assembly protein [Sphingomonas mucosissima]OWK32984.1 hypothetical protein SPMU_13280 [Sphingomonas mucosissima]
MARNAIGTFLGRFRRDVRGNTLAIMAAALIPLTAMVGSGVDMTRAYMAQNRFRQACDAGALAGRRLLAGTTLSQTVRDEATKYFQFNFPQGLFQSSPYSLNMSVPAVGTLKIESTSVIPTTIMKMFGFETLPISASCSATQDFVGTDIMLVLDMSGSMNCAPGVAGACNNVEAWNSKMGALRAAATSLYDTLKDAQDQLHANNLRLRYGFVPYNATVNVGRIVFAKNPDYLRSGKYVYNTRVPKTEPVRDSWSNKTKCDAVGGTYAGYLGSNLLGVCDYTTISTTEWTYGKFEQDISAYVTGASVRTPTSFSSTARSTWAGCIEERQTNNTDINGGTATTAPADAWDLDINRIPNSDDSRWAPWWPEVTVNGTGSMIDGPENCASQASRLREYYNDKTSFTNYLASLKPLGSTYHDIGMIWGARFISPDGIFRSATPETNNPNDPDNPKKLRGFNVRKYIIFMTDGDMAPTLSAYSTYGVEELDKRVLGAASGSTAQLNRHLQRFRMACNAAKSQNVEVWVIAFSTTLTTDMQRCASDPSKAAGISNTPELIAKFQEIGSKIGSLRLSQ